MLSKPEKLPELELLVLVMRNLLNKYFDFVYKVRDYLHRDEAEKKNTYHFPFDIAKLKMEKQHFLKAFAYYWNKKIECLK